MKREIQYKRVLLKISGESLSYASNDRGYCKESIEKIVDEIIEAINLGVEVGLVIGAGNLWRGKIGEKMGMNQIRADYMGMLGTVMNGLIVKDSFERRGISCKIMTSFGIGPIGELFNSEKAVKYLEEGSIVIFAGGTGHPFFTTDTTAVLRGLEIDAEAIMKATKVDGIYSDDPMKNLDAIRYTAISYDQALSMDLKVMDSTAFSLCKENGIPIVVFNFHRKNAFIEAIFGDYKWGTIVS